MTKDSVPKRIAQRAEEHRKAGRRTVSGNLAAARKSCGDTRKATYGPSERSFLSENERATGLLEFCRELQPQPLPAESLAHESPAGNCAA